MLRIGGPELIRLVTALIILYSVTLESLGQAQTLTDPRLHVREVVSGLSQPTSMAFIGSRDILVLQKADGRVRRVINGILQPGEVLDVAVDSASERGLLGIARHPAFPTNPSVYLYYTESSTPGDTSGSPAPLGNRVYRYTWTGSALANPVLILDLPVTPGPNHNGGTMTFGPDGKLYIVIGELNRTGQLQNISGGAAPDNTGVIFRINDDGSAPIDNPFFSQGDNLGKYFAYGIRNSFGLAFDPITGKLWDTENGPASYDEINLVEPGFNSGWNQIMGPDARDPQGVNDLVQFPGSHYADPKFSWFNTVAPTALVFMRSPRLGIQYQDDLFVGDTNNGNLYRFMVNDSRDGFLFATPALADLVADSSAEFDEVLLGRSFSGITDLKIGPDGLLYVLSFAGRILVISGPSISVDFDDDGKSDIGIYRDGVWSIIGSSDSGNLIVGWGGAPQDVVVPADYDGDGITDIAIYRDGVWSIRRSSDGGNTVISWGGPGLVPVPADYDGDGKADIAIYSNGVWSILRSSDGGSTVVGWGGPGFTPVPADYDGDGKSDIAVYSNGTWSIKRSSDGGNTVVAWGGPAFTPVPADYDGDGKADIAVYSDGVWSIVRSADGGNTLVGWGGPAFTPVPADYDGDGKADIAVFHASGVWSIKRSSDNSGIVVGWGGGVQDIPLN